jgi:hypothetical protein
MIRFSLSTLFVSVLAVGLGCAALLNPTPLLERIVFTATVALLGGATLAGLYLPKSTRAFYGGFAVAGWLYFAIVSAPLSTETDFALSSQSVKDRLLTTDCLTLLDPILAKPVPAPEVPKQIRIGITRTGEGIYSRNPEYYYPTQPVIDRAAFYNIGHLLFVLLFGAVGGTLAHGWQKAARTDVKSTPESKGN